MSLERTKYGVEYDPGRDEGGSSGVGWIVVAVLAVAAVSFAVTIARRISSSSADELEPPIVVDPSPPSAPQAQPGAVSPVPDVPPLEIDGLAKRPPKVRSLLLKLEDATKNSDLEMQISAIEQICALPAADSAQDIVSDLIPRLGCLNWSWLFDRHNPQWVREVVVKRGDSADRIAREHGCTLECMKLLNGWEDASRLVAGTRVKVMNHPVFTIVVYKRMKVVDLYLKGKLFKRYLLPDAADAGQCAPGVYKAPARPGSYLRRMGVELEGGDADELDMLVPAGAQMNVTS